MAPLTLWGLTGILPEVSTWHLHSAQDWFSSYLYVHMCQVVTVMSDSSNPLDCSPEAPLSMEFSGHEYWSGLICPFPGDLPNPGIEPEFPVTPASQANSLSLSPLGKPHVYVCVCIYTHTQIHITDCQVNFLKNHLLRFFVCVHLSTTSSPTRASLF